MSFRPTLLQVKSQLHLEKWIVPFATIYLLWRLGLLAAAWLAKLWIPETTGFLARESTGRYLPYLVQVWANMDGAIFTLLAQQGYAISQVPFFPLYPLTIRWTGWLLGTTFVVSGLIVSALTFFGAIYFLRKLLRLDKMIDAWWLFLILLLTFPTAHYYSAVYNDALFLFLACGCLWFGRQKNWLVAAIFGGCAAITRLTGLSLFFYLGAEYLITLKPSLAFKWDIPLAIKTFLSALDPRRIWRDRTWLLAIVPLFFLGYLLFIQLKFGDWQLFIKGVEVWHRSKLTFPLQTGWRYVKILILYPSINLPYFVAWGEALATLLYLIAIVWSWQKIRLSYWVFMVIALLIPVSTGTLQGMPRYGLHLYPLFLIYTLWLKDQKNWVRWVWAGVGMGLMFLYLAAFTRGYFVA
jgi:hypothetical protein